MSGSVMRVVVGAPNALHSSVWRYWKNHDDLYVAQMGGRHVYKLSLHASGIWRLAFLSSAQLGATIGTDTDPRVIRRWRRPEQLGEGWTLCFVLTVPMVEIRERFDVSSLWGGVSAKVRWLEALPRGQKYTIALFLAESADYAPEQVMTQGDETIGSIELDSGRIFWLIARRESMIATERALIDPIPENVQINVSQTQQAGIFAAATVIEDGHLYPAIIEIALGRGNLSYSDSN
jgi:hypothetical protein